MKWEYMVSMDEENISELGIQGWELVSAVGLNNKVQLYFKRPFQSLKDRITVEQRETVYKEYLEGAE